MLTKFDELTCHQIVSTFDGPESTDRAWTEKMWFNLHDTRGEICVAAGVGVYPNRNVMDGFGCIGLGHSRQHNLRVSRELRPRIDELHVGPLEIDVVEPFKKIRLHLGENNQGFGFDLEFLGALPPNEEKPQFGRMHGRTFVHTCRYAQMGRARGTVTVEGKRIDLDPASTYAQRDHSWGIRMGVGAQEQGVQGSDIQHFNGMMINWLTAQFSEWGVYYYLIEKQDGTIDYLSGAVHKLGTDPAAGVPIIRVEHDFSYHPRSVRMKDGNVRLHAADGRVIELAMREIHCMYLRGGGYVGHKGFTHGLWMGPSWSDGETFDLSGDQGRNEFHGLDDTVCEYRCGGEVGYGIIENMILPPYPRYGFNFTPEQMREMAARMAQAKQTGA